MRYLGMQELNFWQSFSEFRQNYVLYFDRIFMVFTMKILMHMQFRDPVSRKLSISG